MAARTAATQAHLWSSVCRLFIVLFLVAGHCLAENPANGTVHNGTEITASTTAVNNLNLTASLPVPAESLPKQGPSSTLAPAPPPRPITKTVLKTSHIVAPDVPPGAVEVRFEAYDTFSTLIYIIVGLTIVILAYMVVRNFRSRYATVRAERYGLRRRWRDQELQPLGREEEDEDTLFEARTALA